MSAEGRAVAGREPTMAQRKLMQRLEGGAFLLGQYKQYRLYKRGHGCVGLAPATTVRALCRYGWMSSIQIPDAPGRPGGPPEFILTDLGRAALAAAPAAGGEGE